MNATDRLHELRECAQVLEGRDVVFDVRVHDEDFSVSGHSEIEVAIPGDDGMAPPELCDVLTVFGFGVDVDASGSRKDGYTTVVVR